MKLFKKHVSPGHKTHYVLKVSIYLAVAFLFLSTEISGQELSFTKLSIGELGGANYIELADIDGDMSMDVVGAGARSNSIVWFQSPGWNAHTIVENWIEPYISVGDMDSDGDVDVVSSSWTIDEVAWFENPGWTKHIIDANLDGAVGVRVADMDGDDTMDVVAAGAYVNELVWYKGPTWDKHVVDDNVVSSPQNADNVFVTDIDDDQDPDIVTLAFDWTIRSTGSIIIYEGGTEWNKKVIDSQAGWVFNIDFGDMDRDGDIDIAAGFFNRDMVVWYEAPDWTRHTIDSDLNAAGGVAIGDINLDDTLDVVAGGQNTTNPLRWYLGPDFKMKVAYSADYNYLTLKLFDMDNDSDLDIVSAIVGNNEVAWFENDLITGIEEIESNLNPNDFRLMQNYPNPFNPITSIDYHLSVVSDVQLLVFNLHGQKVATLVLEKQSPGSYQVLWDASGMASGIYYYQLVTESFIDTKRMILLR
jgi:hypothetical protein